MWNHGVGMRLSIAVAGNPTDRADHVRGDDRLPNWLHNFI